MASTNRRTAEELPDTDRPSKRHKQGLDKGAYNPYLAHMFEEKEPSVNESGRDWTNTPGSRLYKPAHYKEIGSLDPFTGEPVNGSDQDVWTGFELHKTSAKMAHDIEEGPLNPFTGQPLSKKYFDILRTRRNLPVHLQR